MGLWAKDERAAGSQTLAATKRLSSIRRPGRPYLIKVMCSHVKSDVLFLLVRCAEQGRGGGGGAGRTKNLNNVADIRGLGFRVGVRGSVLCS